MTAEELRAAILDQLEELDLQELEELEQYLDSLDADAGTPTE
jgi:hypothetical protein